MKMRAATVVQVLQDFEAPPTIAPRPPTTVANQIIDRSLGSKKTHIQSHNRSAAARCGCPGAVAVATQVKLHQSLGKLRCDGRLMAAGRFVVARAGEEGIHDGVIGISAGEVLLPSTDLSTGNTRSPRAHATDLITHFPRLPKSTGFPLKYPERISGPSVQ